MDKIGDLVVSMPVDQHPALTGQRVHWLVSRGLSFVAENAEPKRAVSEFRRSFGIGDELFRMVRWFKQNKPRTVVLLHTPWWVSFAAWLAGVPERIGRLSQWHSFLFLNLGFRQSRKGGERHESDFNFDLVESGFHRLGHRSTPDLATLKRDYLHLNAPSPATTLEARGLKSRGYRVVHPGMGGSALNWPAENFSQLISQLAQDRPVVITGTKADHKFLEGIKSVKDTSNVIWLVDQLKISELLDILSQASSVIAPSTGVLHLAASLDTPVVGIYSPRKMEHPSRWGPKGPICSVLVPQVEDTGKLQPEVMREIKVEQVYQAVLLVETGKAHHDLATFPTP
jgi:ADP-heptose:LPS heptosyltransferase